VLGVKRYVIRFRAQQIVFFYEFNERSTQGFGGYKLRKFVQKMNFGLLREYLLVHIQLAASDVLFVRRFQSGVSIAKNEDLEAGARAFHDLQADAQLLRNPYHANQYVSDECVAWLVRNYRNLQGFLDKERVVRGKTHATSHHGNA